MLIEIVFHVLLCSALCVFIHLFFHKRNHTKHELSETEIKELREVLKATRKSATKPLTEARPDLLRK